MAGHGGLRRVAPPSVEQVGFLAEAMGPLRAFTLVAAWSGLRLECEVARLVREDVHALPGDENCTLHVRAGKGGKERRSVLFAPGHEALVEAHEWGHLFRNARGLPWTRKSVNKHWRRASESVGLGHLVFHDLRKFHASWLLDRGVSRMDVAIQLGHFDKYGRPNTDLIDRVYGWPDPSVALARVAAAA